MNDKTPRSKCDQLKAELAAAKAVIAQWEEKYHQDYHRAVQLLKEANETGEKLITVRDTVIAITKMLHEIENLKSKRK